MVFVVRDVVAVVALTRGVADILAEHKTLRIDAEGQAPCLADDIMMMMVMAMVLSLLKTPLGITQMCTFMGSIKPHSRLDFSEP